MLPFVVKVRQDLTQELGYIIPKVQFIENPTLEENSFSINIHGVSVINSGVYPDCLAFWEDELNIDKLPKNSIKAKDTLTQRKIIWINKEECKNYWAKGMEPAQYVASYIYYFAVLHVDEIFDYNDLNRYIDLISSQNSFLVDNILGDYISISELKYLLVQLIRERVSIKDITFIFEKLNDFSDNPNKADLLDRLRMALSRQISAAIANEDKEIYAFELSEETYKVLEKQIDKEDMSMKINLAKFSKLKKNLNANFDEILNKNAVILVPQVYRQVMFIVISQLFMDIPVICYEELALDYKLKILGQI